MNTQAAPPAQDRAEWLAWRTRGIGASDIAGILGISPWQTPYSVWQSKIGGGSGGTSGDAEYLRWGSLLEDAILTETQRRVRITILETQPRCTHPEHQWALATPDAKYADDPEATAPTGVVEAKTTSESRWDDVPAHYQAQVQWQLEVTGLDHAWIACLHNGRRLTLWSLERDPAIGADLLEVAGDFWTRHVQRGEPPPVDGRAATTEALNRRWPSTVPEMTADLDSLAEEIAQLRDIRAAEKDLAADRAALENLIRAELGPAEAGTIGGVIAVTWRTHTRRSIDTSRLRDDHPELAAGYTTETTVRPLRLAGQEGES